MISSHCFQNTSIPSKSRNFSLKTVLGLFVGLLCCFCLSIANESRPSANLVEAGSTKATGLMNNHLNVRVSIENPTLEPMRYFLVMIEGYTGGENPKRIAFKKGGIDIPNYRLIDPMTTGSAEQTVSPKELRGGSFLELVELDSPISAGESVEKSWVYSISDANVQSLKSISIYLIDYGDESMLLRSLALDILDLKDRKAAAQKLSHSRKLRYQYMDQSGNWKHCFADSDPEYSMYEPAPESAYSEFGEREFSKISIDSGECVLDIRNETEIHLNIRLMGSGEHYSKTISPGAMTQLKIKPGRFFYSASGKRVRADRGIEVFEAGHQYSWEFFIRKN